MTRIRPAGAPAYPNRFGISFDYPRSVTVVFFITRIFSNDDTGEIAGFGAKMVRVGPLCIM